MNWSKIVFLIGIIAFAISCEQDNPNYQEDANQAQFLHRSVKKLTDVIIHDIFSPPQAARIYAYPSIAAYEIMQQGSNKYQSLAGQLHELQTVPQLESNQEYCLPVASTQAFLQVGKALIFSEDKMENFQKEVAEEFKAIKIPTDVYDRSLAYGNQVAEHILAWADKDNYKQTRTFPKFSITDNPAEWKPTPPDYMDGIEPHWMKIRPFVLDSAQQFAPPPPTPFDMDENSLFYKELMEVYLAMEEDGAERLEIAQFWDCNPYVSQHIGHVMTASKKITPGGHWMGIAYIAATTTDAGLMKSAATYAKTTIALSDAFISCWDEKYNSKLIRPETVINTYLDEDWLPALQTPPFPEYTSGHSVISRAAAVVLTDMYGDDFAFVDSTEVEYGLPVRKFDSFFAASEEAAVSRLYGGIHYRPAIDNGVVQGEQVGKLIKARVKLQEEKLSLK
ncbi:MAG: vanadium-dependent haloperoxidase [Saprospiraceae bacterium]